jgi:hypothetical protein
VIKARFVVGRVFMAFPQVVVAWNRKRKASDNQVSAAGIQSVFTQYQSCEICNIYAASMASEVTAAARAKGLLLVFDGGGRRARPRLMRLKRKGNGRACYQPGREMPA